MRAPSKPRADAGIPQGPKPKTLAAWAWMDAHQGELLHRIATESTQCIKEWMETQGLQTSIHTVRDWFRKYPQFHGSIGAKRKRAGLMGGYQTHHTVAARTAADFDEFRCRRIPATPEMLARLRSRLTPEARAERIVLTPREEIA